MKKLDIFVASKNSILPNYIFLFVKEFVVDRSVRLAIEFNTEVDILIIDTDTISPVEAKPYMEGKPTLLFTRHRKPFLISYTSRYDINGVLSLEMEPDALIKTIANSSEGEIYYDEEMISILFSPKMNELAKKVDSITSREMDIILLMLKDFTNESIADELNLSVRTVNAHKGNIMRKIGAKTTSGMIKIVIDYSPYLVVN